MLITLKQERTGYRYPKYELYDTSVKMVVGSVECDKNGRWELCNWEEHRRWGENFTTIEEAKAALIKEIAENRDNFNKWLEQKRSEEPEDIRTGSKAMALLTEGNDEFYPTPYALAGKMLGKLRKDTSEYDRILEPSAGKGNLVVATCKYFERKSWRKYSRYTDTEMLKAKFDVIERDISLQCLLLGKGLRLVGDDFLNFNTNNHYDLILMNPGFSDGDRHLLKAISLVEPLGGEIVCLLNAETVRNPYTVTRIALKDKLAEYGADIEFVKHGFSRAERRSDVECAIVHLDIPRKMPYHTIMDGLEEAKRKVCDEEKKDCEMTVFGDFVTQLVGFYNADAAAGLRFLSEFFTYDKVLAEGTESTATPLVSVQIDGRNASNGSLTSNYNAFLTGLRTRYWHSFFNRDELTSKMTSDMQKAYHGKVSEMKDYDFNEFNLRRVLAEIQSQLVEGVEESITNLFETLTVKHSWSKDEPIQDNVHFYSGWETNKSWRVNDKKCIIPMYSAFDWNGQLDYYKVSSILGDLERALNYLDRGEIKTHCNMYSSIKSANDTGKTRNVEFTYFTCDFFKKGTCHIKFRPEARIVIDRLNIHASRKRGWLPPSYGRKKYHDMSQEERDVIDSFQGEEEYSKVMANPDRYILSASNFGQMLLTES